MRVLASVALLLAACNPLPRTFLEGCTGMANSAYDVGEKCDFVSQSREEWLRGAVPACCASPGTHCSENIDSDLAESYARCSDAIARMDCGSFAAFTRGELLPLECD